MAGGEVGARRTSGARERRNSIGATASETAKAPRSQAVIGGCGPGMTDSSSQSGGGEAVPREPARRSLPHPLPWADPKQWESCADSQRFRAATRLRTSLIPRPSLPGRGERRELAPPLPAVGKGAGGLGPDLVATGQGPERVLWARPGSTAPFPFSCEVGEGKGRGWDEATSAWSMGCAPCLTPRPLSDCAGEGESSSLPCSCQVREGKGRGWDEAITAGPTGWAPCLTPCPLSDCAGEGETLPPSLPAKCEKGRAGDGMRRYQADRNWRCKTRCAPINERDRAERLPGRVFNRVAWRRRAAGDYS